jgi:hypothetical protein
MSWNINTNFTNVRAMGSGSTAPEEGAYIVTIAKTEAMDSKKQAGLVNVKVFASVNDDGYEVSDIFPLPNGMDEKKDRIFLAKWKSLLLSIGYDGSQLDAQVNISEEWLLNREAYIYFVPRRQGEKGSFDETMFISSEKYEAVKQGKWKPRPSNGGGSSTNFGDAPAIPTATVIPTPVASPAPVMRAAAPVPTPPAPPKAGGALSRILG